jgi:activator of 2-hydroxyglutaryl-CoA dehydratase
MKMVPNRSASIVGIVLSAFIGGAIAQQRGTVECEATLLEYQARYRWTEWHENVETSFIAPLATFRIEAPSALVGRTVRVIFMTSEFSEVLPESADATGGRYELELPADYLAGKDGLIIRADLVLSLERSAH